MLTTRIVSSLATILIAAGLNAIAAEPLRITVTANDRVALAGPVGVGPFRNGRSPFPESKPFPGVAKPKRRPPPPTLLYPYDQGNYYGGPTLHSFEAHDVFVDPVPMGGGRYGQSPAGPSIDDADTFLTHFFASRMMHISDQYTGTSAAYTVGKSGMILDSGMATLYHPQDFQAFVHAAGRTFGTGPQHLINVFFDKGVDVCPFDDSGCYSPDNVATWDTCAGHYYFDYPDIGRVYFTYQPYQDVLDQNFPVSLAGCATPDGGMHGQAIDSMANSLSHEIFESITDPELTSWWNYYYSEDEVADTCLRLWFDIPLDGRSYRLQAEYSNLYHACVWTP